MTCISNSWTFLFDFGRPITSLSPKNMPCGCHQYVVTLVAQIVAQILRLLFKSILVDKVLWYVRFFLILPHNDYTFVTSPVLSAIPSPALICSIVGSPNRLDLCLKLLFDCQNSLNNGYVEGSFIRLLEPVGAAADPKSVVRNLVAPRIL